MKVDSEPLRSHREEHENLVLFVVVIEDNENQRDSSSHGRTKYMRRRESSRRIQQEEMRTLVALCRVDDSCDMLWYAVACGSECVFIWQVWHYENPNSFLISGEHVLVELLYL